MATITSVEIIKTILSNNGSYPGDPQICEAYSYQDSSGRTLFAIFHSYQFCDIYDSPFVFYPVLLFDKAEGLTEAGKELLEKLK